MHSLAFVLLAISLVGCLPTAATTRDSLNTVRIGVLLEKVSVNLSIVQTAQRNVNDNDRILGKTRQLEVLTKYIDDFDPVLAVRTVCDWLDDTGITTLISSASCATSVALQAIMSRVNIPHLRLPTAYCDFSAYSNLTTMTLSIQPHIDNINKALLQIVLSQNWNLNKSIIIFFDESLDCQKGQAIRAAFSPVNYTFYHTAFDLRRNATNDATARIFESFKTDTNSEFIFILMGSPQAISGIFNQATSQVKMISGLNTWIISTPKFDFTTLAANETSSTVAVLQPSEERTTKDLLSPASWDDIVGTTQALNQDVYDSIIYVSCAIHNLQESVKNLLPRKDNFTCWPAIREAAAAASAAKTYTSTPNQWSHGQTLYNNIQTALNSPDYIRSIIFGSETNPKIERPTPMFDIYTYGQTRKSWYKSATWHPTRGLNATKAAFSSYKGLKDQNLKIVTVEEVPFMIKKRIGNTTVEYSGFCKDLLDEIARSLGFSYTIYDVDAYGKQEKNGIWVGAIGEVVNKKADMALSGMTIIAEREKVVDFSVRYMDYGVGIIISKPVPKAANILGFLQPLSNEVWGCIMLAIIFEGLILLVITKVSPYTKFTTPDIEDSDKRRFKVKNSFWFTMSSVLQQGPEDQPRTISGRVLAMFWYFFTLIMVATYTANLAAFLTITRLDTPIQSLDDLVDQVPVSYGTVNDSSVQRAFKEQSESNPLYERITAYFDKRPENLVTSSEIGYRRVGSEEYAFMWDEPVLQYMAATNCDLMTVGKPFLLKGYGIALQRGVPYREDVNNVILALQESGKLDKMRRKWFEPKSTCKGGDGGTGSAITATGIQFSNVAGVFYVLILGSCVAIMTAMGEAIWYRLRANITPRNSPHNKKRDGELAAYQTADGPEKEFWAPGLNFNMQMNHNSTNGQHFSANPAGLSRAPSAGQGMPPPQPAMHTTPNSMDSGYYQTNYGIKPVCTSPFPGSVSSASMKKPAAAQQKPDFYEKEATV